MHVDLISDSFVILRQPLLFLFSMNKNYSHTNYWFPPRPVGKEWAANNLANAYDEALLHVGGKLVTMPLIPWVHNIDNYMHITAGVLNLDVKTLTLPVLYLNH